MQSKCKKYKSIYMSLKNNQKRKKNNKKLLFSKDSSFKIHVYQRFKNIHFFNLFVILGMNDICIKL